MNDSTQYMLNWWLKDNSFSDDELKFLTSFNTEEIKFESKEKYNNLLLQYFKKMPACNLNIENSTIRFDESATNLINALFSEYVDKDTLVVSSILEHPSVNMNLDKIDNKILLDEYDVKTLNIKNIQKEILKYKKVFVYIIGTHVKDGYTTAQDLYLEIRKFCNNHNIKSTIVIDSVQEMFLIPRDYSIFDYVIGTAHAIIRNFDMGILIINNKNKEFGKPIYNWANTYLKMLELITAKREKLYQFRNIMTQYYFPIISKKHFKVEDDANGANYFFHMTDELGQLNPDLRTRLKKYEIESDDNRILRFRGTTYLQKPELLLQGIKFLNMLLEDFE